MANFVISAAKRLSSQAEEVINYRLSQSSSDSGDERNSSVTTCLYLKPSSEAKSASHHQQQPLDKDVVLRRIRRHKRSSKIRSTFQALLSSIQQHQWMEEQLDDAFSAP